MAKTSESTQPISKLLTQLRSLFAELSGWYWGAIGVIILAAIAQFVQNAPAALPDSARSIDLSDAQLEVVYPEEVRMDLREADREPIALTLRSTTSVTYTVALSTSAPLLFTDVARQPTNPRVELAVVGCCQSSALLYPQASSSGWWWNSIGLDVYADRQGATVLATPVAHFDVRVEPGWKTGARRVFLLFTDLGLAVAVALAFVGWALERKQQTQQRHEDIWQARLEDAQKTCETGLLKGISELLLLRDESEDRSEEHHHFVRLNTILKNHRKRVREVNDSLSLLGEICLEDIVERVLEREEVSDGEFRAIDYLFDDEPSVGDTQDSIGEHFKMLSKRIKDTSADDLLKATKAIYCQGQFKYSLAIRNLAIEMVREWYKAKYTNNELDEQNVKEVSEVFVELLLDPRLAHIPFGSRTGIYRVSFPTVEHYFYSWADPDNIEKIQTKLLAQSRIDASKLPIVYLDSWRFCLPLQTLRYQPFFLRFLTSEDCACVAYLLYMHFLSVTKEGLQTIDRGSHVSKLNSPASGEIEGDISHNSALPPGELATGRAEHIYVPFVVWLRLVQAAEDDKPLVSEHLRQLVRAVAEEWIRFFACSPELWGEFTSVERTMLAGLLHFAAETEVALQHRMLQYRRINECIPKPVGENSISLHSKKTASENDEVNIRALAANIARFYRNANFSETPDVNLLESWLALRPPYFTHTVLVVQNVSSSTPLVLCQFAVRLKARNVVLHLLTTQPPPLQLLHVPVKDCTMSKRQLARILDSAIVFGQGDTSSQDSISFVQRVLDEDSIDLADYVADALLSKAEGSPSRLLHMVYRILLNHTENPIDEFTLNHQDIMQVVQSEPMEC